MSPEELASAIASYLDQDRQQSLENWPGGALAVRRDPRIEFLRETIGAGAQVRVTTDPDGEERELAGVQVQLTAKIYVGFAVNVLTVEQYDAAITWGRHLINVMDLERLAGCNWSHLRPARWVYQSDPSSISTNKDGSVAGDVVGLFEMTWMTVQP